MTRSVLLGVFVFSGMAIAQTAIDLKAQSKNVDFSTSVTTRPVKTGTVLPATCQVGELFFKTNSQAGQNLFGCTALNTWMQQSGGGSGGGSSLSSQLLDFAVTRSSAVVLTVGASCSAAMPCNVRFGNTVHTFTTGATASITGGSGSGTVIVFVSNSGAIVVEHAAVAGLTMTCSGCTASQVASPALPSNSVPLAGATVSNGQWDTAVTDLRAMFSSRAITAGSGIQVIDGLGDAVVSADPAVVPGLGANNVFVGENDFSASTRMILKNGAGAPAGAECSAAAHAGRVYVRRDAAASQSSFYICANTGADVYAWELSQGGGGGSFAMTTANSGWLELTGTGGGNLNPSAASTAYYVELHLPFAVKIANIGYNVPAGNFGSNYVAWGLYDASCALVAGTSGRGDLGTGHHIAAISSPATIGPGVFYFGFAFDSTAPIISASNRLLAGILQNTNPPRLFRGGNAPTGSGATLAMPSGCGTKTGESFVIPTFYVVE